MVIAHVKKVCSLFYFDFFRFLITQPIGFLIIGWSGGVVGPCFFKRCMSISAVFLSHATSLLRFWRILIFSIHADHAKNSEKKVLRCFTCILDPPWKYHAFTWFRLRCRSRFSPCWLHGPHVKWKTLGNNGTFFLGDGGSRNDLHGIFSWTIFEPRGYYHETYGFYHDFLPCCFRVFVQWMYAFLGFFDHAERSHVSFLPFWVIFLTWGLLCFYMGVFFLHWMFFM